MHIIIKYYPIFNLTSILQVPLASTISYLFPMDTHLDFYIVTIRNEKNTLAKTTIQVVRDKTNFTTTSTIKPTLARRRPSYKTTLE